MSTKTAAALEAALDAHIRDEFPGEHDDAHLTSWVVVGGYEDLEHSEHCNYSVDGPGKNHESVGLLRVGIDLMLDARD